MRYSSLRLVPFHFSLCCSHSLSRRILESFTQNAYYCWKGLWGSPWHVAGSVCWDWGRGLWASSALCVGRASCTLSGWPALPFTFCLPPVATSWQLMCTHDQLRGTLRPGLMDALLGWGWCWQPVKADVGAWLAVPELSDQFGEICSPTAAHPFAASSGGYDGVGLGCLQANEQQLSVLELDYMFHTGAFWLKQWVVQPVSELKLWDAHFLLNHKLTEINK